MNRLFASAALILALGCQYAQAQDGPDAFNGPYLGVQGGYGWADVDGSFEGAEIGDIELSGFQGGAFAGYGGTNGRLYGAIEVEGSYVGAEESFSAYGTPVDVEGEYSVGVSGIAGGLVSDSVLLYTRVGYEYLRAEASALGISESEGFSGIRLGAGADIAMTDHLRARAEYSYTLYSDKDYSELGYNYGIEPSQSLVRAGLLYSF